MSDWLFEEDQRKQTNKKRRLTERLTLFQFLNDYAHERELQAALFSLHMSIGGTKEFLLWRLMKATESRSQRWVLAFLNMDSLKGACSDYHLPVGGNKDDLLDRVVANILTRSIRGGTNEMEIGDFKYVDCGEFFQTREELAAHRQLPCDMVSEISQVKKRIPLCAVHGCDQCFNSKVGLDIHLSTTHGIQSRNPGAACRKKEQANSDSAVKAEMIVRKRAVELFSLRRKLETLESESVLFFVKCGAYWKMAGIRPRCPDRGRLLKPIR